MQKYKRLDCFRFAITAVFTQIVKVEEQFELYLEMFYRYEILSKTRYTYMYVLLEAEITTHSMYSHNNLFKMYVHMYI